MLPKLTPVDVPVASSPSLGFDSNSSFGLANSVANVENGDQGVGQ